MCSCKPVLANFSFQQHNKKEYWILLPFAPAKWTILVRAKFSHFHNIAFNEWICVCKIHEDPTTLHMKHFYCHAVDFFCLFSVLPSPFAGSHILTLRSCGFFLCIFPWLAIFSLLWLRQCVQPCRFRFSQLFSVVFWFDFSAEFDRWL